LLSTARILLYSDANKLVEKFEEGNYDGRITKAIKEKDYVRTMSCKEGGSPPRILLEQLLREADECSEVDSITYSVLRP
jgi:hypothetical protein